MIKKKFEISKIVGFKYLWFQLDKQQFEETVQTLNNLYAEAEKLGGKSYLEGFLACMTAYTIFLCMETHYEKVKLFLMKGLCDINFFFGGVGPMYTIKFCSVCVQVLKKIARYINDQNEKIYAPRGLLLTDPIERGLRVVSLCNFHYIVYLLWPKAEIKMFFFMAIISSS